LTSLALDRVSSHDFVQTVCELLGAQVLGQVDERGELVAVHAEPSAERAVAELAREAGALAGSSSATTEQMQQEGSELVERWFVPVRAGNSRLGYLFAAFSAPQGSVALQSLEQS